MTLIIGMKCKYKDDTGLLFIADKAVTKGFTKGKEGKLVFYKDCPIIWGGSGVVADVQRYSRKLKKLFSKASVERGNLDIECLKDLLYSDSFVEQFKSTRKLQIDIILGISDNFGVSVFTLSGDKVVEHENYALIGSGEAFGADIFMEMLYSHSKLPDFQSCARMAVFILNFVGKYTNTVSSNFDMCLMLGDKIGSLNKTSKMALIADSREILKSWESISFITVTASTEKSKNLFKKIYSEEIFSNMPGKEKENIILVIDDKFESQKEVYNPLLKYAKKKDYKVINIKKRDEYLDKLKEISKDTELIILDRIIEMKETIDILDILKIIVGVPIVLLSRKANESDILPFLKKGITIHLSKEEIEEKPEKFEALLDSIVEQEDYIIDWEAKNAP